MYQAALFPVYKFGGLWGLTLFNSLLVTAAFAFLYFATRGWRLEKILAILAVSVLGGGVFSLGVRGQLVGFLFFCATLWVLDRARRDGRWSLLLPPLMLLWANSHGSVILGVILLAYFWLKSVLGKYPRLLFLSAVALLAVLSTLINPFGFDIYRDAWRHFAQAGLDQLIAEWVPAGPITQLVVILSGLGALGSLGYLGWKKKAWGFWVLGGFVGAFTFWALQARRNVPLYFSLIFFLFFTARESREFLSRWLRNRELRNSLALALAILLLLVAPLASLPRAVRANQSWESFCELSPLTYPYRAVEFLRSQPEKGNIFDRYEWGGFLIWQLPEYKFFVDGRMPAWGHPSGKSPYTIYLEILQTQPGWEETLAEYGIDWILISPGTFMDLKLAPDPGEPGWEEVYRDEVAVVYKKLKTESGK